VSVKMKKLLIPVLFVAILFAGCTNTWAFLSANQTILNLNEGNYSISATNVNGESEAAYIFRLSYSSGLMASTLAIARVKGSGQMYAEALENLWSNYESAHGSVTNQKLALANIRFDTDILNLFFYTKVRLIVRADIVEFQ
jgi:hypothetical protein